MDEHGKRDGVDGVDVVDDIAAAETLEQLAEILWETDNAGTEHEAFRDLTHSEKEAHITGVTAILQAARPVVDLKPGSVWRCGKSELHYEDLDALNARIRFKFAMPEADGGYDRGYRDAIHDVGELLATMKGTP